MKKRVLVPIASLVILGSSENVAAVGFALEQQSVSNFGYAFAGVTIIGVMVHDKDAAATVIGTVTRSR
jgi:hypothetical protein